jgi:uncharacterized membrane protein (DUF106 family)
MEEKKVLLTNEILWFCILIIVAICLIMCGLLLINKVSEMHEMHEMKKYIDELNEEFKDVELINDEYEEPKHE